MWRNINQLVCKTFHEKGNLVSIHSSKENSFIFQLITKVFGLADGAWIGMDTLTSKEFRWQDRSDVKYTNWRDIEDSNYCAWIKPSITDMKWEQGYCNFARGFVCAQPVRTN
ncbi:dromaiocalcin-1-like [Callorhinchus milii]|uniref:dromaiocalcin-1-like n=1 Tax=Callorhinchus milii TaxID=7868 RepID=UPI0004571363|nr:dromaiocalcin-1-like [Callorhinchus milii]|eukprot:gi/632954905/ref/XP_007893211.1/ PREDICTED: C-type lectin lectoxin-Lio2-like [Callorhinchus milii]